MSTLQQLAGRGRELLADSGAGIDDELLEALQAWSDELQQVLQHPPSGPHTREELEQILVVNEGITDVIRNSRDELGANIRQTRTGMDAVKAYQGKG